MIPPDKGFILINNKGALETTGPVDVNQYKQDSNTPADTTVKNVVEGFRITSYDASSAPWNLDPQDMPTCQYSSNEKPCVAFIWRKVENEPPGKAINSALTVAGQVAGSDANFTLTLQIVKGVLVRTVQRNRVNVEHWVGIEVDASMADKIKDKYEWKLNDGTETAKWKTATAPIAFTEGKKTRYVMILPTPETPDPNIDKDWTLEFRNKSSTGASVQVDRLGRPVPS